MKFNKTAFIGILGVFLLIMSISNIVKGIEINTLKQYNTLLKTTIEENKKVIAEQEATIKSQSEQLIEANETLWERDQEIEYLKSNEIDPVAYDLSMMENEALKLFFKNKMGYEVGKIIKAPITATMYTSAEGAWSKNSPHYGTMANGKIASRGSAAAPRNIPFKSVVLFPNDIKHNESDEVFVIGDRGGAITQSPTGVVDIDIWTSDQNQKMVNEFGMQRTTGYIIIPKEGD